MAMMKSRLKLTANTWMKSKFLRQMFQKQLNRLISNRKKRTFSLIDLADSGPEQSKTLDEVSVYILMNIEHVKEEGKRFLNDDYSELKFWFSRKRQHPALYTCAERVLATLVSSSPSERVFCAVKLLVTENRSRLSSNILEYIIVTRSLTK